MLARLSLLEGFIPYLSPNFWWLLEISGGPWLVDLTFCLCLHHHVAFPSLCLCVSAPPPFPLNPTTGVRSQISPKGFRSEILILFTTAKTLPLNKVTLTGQGLGVGHVILGTLFNPLHLTHVLTPASLILVLHSPFLSSLT